MVLERNRGSGNKSRTEETEASLLNPGGRAGTEILFRRLSLYGAQDQTSQIGG